MRQSNVKEPSPKKDKFGFNQKSGNTVASAIGAVKSQVRGKVDSSAPEEDFSIESGFEDKYDDDEDLL